MYDMEEDEKDRTVVVEAGEPIPQYIFTMYGIVEGAEETRTQESIIIIRQPRREIS